MSKSFESMFQGSSILYIDYAKVIEEVDSKSSGYLTEFIGATPDEGISQEGAKAVVEKLLYEMYTATLNLSLVTHALMLSTSNEEKARHLVDLMLQDSYQLSMRECGKQANSLREFKGG